MQNSWREMGILNLFKQGYVTLLRACPKVTSPILLCQPTISEVDFGGMAVEAEPSCQYSITFCCYVTDGSRGAV